MSIDYRPILAGFAITTLVGLAAGLTVGAVMARAIHLSHPKGRHL